MARLPDRFDLWIRKARESSDPVRQADYVLGALAGLKEWHFLNVGTPDQPRVAETTDPERALLVFSDPGRIEELLRETGHPVEPLPVITTPTVAAMAWCVELKAGLLVNPGEDAALIPFARVEAFHGEWSRRGGRQAAGFWIPNMTSEEEDFWQQHKL